MQCGGIEALSGQVISSPASGIVALERSYLLLGLLLGDGVEVAMQG